MGRILQVMGAEIEAEVPGTNGTNIDFVADFDGERVGVEAHAKKFDIEMRPETARQRPVLQLLSQLGPADWTLLVDEVPLLSLLRTRSSRSGSYMPSRDCRPLRSQANVSRWHWNQTGGPLAPSRSGNRVVWTPSGCHLP